MVPVAMTERPHVVCIPFPAQGHVNPMLKLAKLLHHQGFYVTFVNSEFNHQRLLTSRGPDANNGLCDFKFETIPDGLPPPSNPNATQDVSSLCDSTSKNCLVPFRNLMSKLNSSDTSPPVTCIVYDGIMSFSLQVAEELGIPGVLFWTASLCGFAAYLHFPHLIQRGLIPLKDESDLTNGYLDTPIDWIPGMKKIRFKDLPSFARTTNINDTMINFILGEVGRSYKASALIVNTFDALENEVLEALKSKLSLPPIYTVGPLHFLIDQLPKESSTQSLESNLWKDEPECLAWLDSKEASSVVYVNFGSVAVLTSQQLIEFAWGLANSKHTFLWIIRPDLVVGDSAVLPPEFVNETRERGMLAGWCPQTKVLRHPSIAGFLTHSGWNSTLESISSGVPMICWPFFAEQQTNCRFSSENWGIGMEIDSNVKRGEVESLVRELMEGERGKLMKNKALEWKNRAAEASETGGSSYTNMDKLVTEVLLRKDANKEMKV